MGSCTSKGASNSKHSSRKPSKTDFIVQDITPYHPDYQASSLPKDKIHQFSNNTTVQRIIPPSINDENHSARIISNNNNIINNNNITVGNSAQKFNLEVGKEQQPHQITQHTHTDCDIQFTSFEMKPQNIPKGSFVGVNNLSDSTYKNIFKEQSNHNIMLSNQNILNQSNINQYNNNNNNGQQGSFIIQQQQSQQQQQLSQQNITKQSSSRGVCVNLQQQSSSNSNKKMIKDNYILSKSDKKKENIAQYLNSFNNNINNNKKGSILQQQQSQQNHNNVQEFQLDKQQQQQEQEIEEKQIAFSGIGIIKAFHNLNYYENNSFNTPNPSNNNNLQMNTQQNETKVFDNISPLPNQSIKNTNGIQNNTNNNGLKDIKSLAQYHQKRMESIFDNMIHRTSEKSVDFYDEHALNFLFLNTQENKESIIGGQPHPTTPFNHNQKYFSQDGQSQLTPIQHQLEQPKSMNKPHNLTIQDDVQLNFQKQNSTQPNKITINILNLSEKDKLLLLKYAKNWLYLSRSYSQKQEYNESLSCLLPAVSLFSQIGLIDQLIIVLIQAYSSFLNLILLKKDDQQQQQFNEMKLRNAEQKFQYIRQTVLSSGQSNYNSIILEKQYSGSFISKLYNPFIQQEPSQKNTEKTFIFDDWKNNNNNTNNNNNNNNQQQQQSNKDKSCNELIIFFELIYNAYKSPSKQFIHVLSSLIEFVENNQNNTIFSSDPKLSLLYQDLFKLNSKLTQTGDDKLTIDFSNNNEGMKHLLEYLDSTKEYNQNQQQQIQQKFQNVSKYLYSLLNDYSQPLINQYIEEANKISYIKLNLKIKPITQVLLKLGHLLRVWLDLSQHALVFYEQAFHQDAQNCEALFFIAITLRNLDKTQEAIQYYNQALEINHYYTECYINLGNIYLQEFQNPVIAEKFYVKALISSYYANVQSTLVCKGRIFNLLGEIQKQNNEYILAGIFYCCGVLKDCLYEENYYDLIEIMRYVEQDVNNQQLVNYFKIIIELVSFSVFEKQDWEKILLNYKNQLKNIYAKSNVFIDKSYFSHLEQIIESEDLYQKFIHDFLMQSLESNETFLQILIKKTISTNIQEIKSLYTKKSLEDESSKEDVQFIIILRDLLNSIT